MTDDKATEAALSVWFSASDEKWASWADRMREAIAAADKVRAEGFGSDHTLKGEWLLGNLTHYPMRPDGSSKRGQAYRENDAKKLDDVVRRAFSAGLAKGEADRAALVEALTPFAEAADFIDNAPSYTRIETQDFIHFTTPDGREFGLSHKECAAARAALALVRKGV